MLKISKCAERSPLKNIYRYGIYSKSVSLCEVLPSFENKLDDSRPYETRVTREFAQSVKTRLKRMNLKCLRLLESDFFVLLSDDPVLFT